MSKPCRAAGYYAFTVLAEMSILPYLQEKLPKDFLFSETVLLTEELIFNKIEPLLQLFRTVLLRDNFSRNRSIVKLCQTGQLTQEQMAQSLEISPGRVSQLDHEFPVAGEAGLVVKPTPGAPSKLTKEQRAQLPDLFSRGAESYGFEGEVWTRARVGYVRRQQFGVTYEVSTVGLLRKELGVTCQKPRRRDYRQNPQSVAPWQEEILPALKTTAAEETRVVLSSAASAFYLLPQLRPTWALAGQTPVLSESCQCTHLEVYSGIGPAGESYYQIQNQRFMNKTFMRGCCTIFNPSFKFLRIFTGEMRTAKRRCWSSEFIPWLVVGVRNLFREVW